VIAYTVTELRVTELRLLVKEFSDLSRILP
jgi:hypothetical protein